MNRLSNNHSRRPAHWRDGLWCCIWLLCGLNAVGAPVPGQDIDRIVVIVNDDVITEIEAETRLQETKAQLSAQKIKLPPEPLLRKQVIERMILERAQLQLAERMGIRVSEDEIDQTIEKIAGRNRTTPDNLYKTLGKQGISSTQYREQLREQLIIQQLVERAVNNRITVSTGEIDEFLQRRNKLLGGQDAYNLAHIMVPIPESASPQAIQQAERQAQKIHDILEKGADFQETAIAYSRDKTALEGGELGWRSAGQLPELFLAALETMRRGGISSVLRSPNGFHILRLNDIRSVKKSKKVTQTRARHILLRPNAVRPENEIRRKLIELKQRIEDGDDFAALARAYSEDSVSAANGGDLGWFNPGQMTPRFEKAADALKPKEISAPVKTGFGLHLIQVLERRSRDIGEELDRNEARKQIRARKADERYQQWIRQLRDETYVEFVSGDEG